MSIEVKQFVLNSSVEGNFEPKKDEQAQCLNHVEKLQTQAIAAEQVDALMAEIRER